MNKIQLGQFYTTKNVFKNNIIFKNFMVQNKLWDSKILEPFAGTNNLINFLLEQNPKLKYESFDLKPANENVKQNDSINNWNYQNFDLVITNPPYLSKNSAKRLKLVSDFQNYDDLYKLALDRCIENVRFTIAIIPTTLINSNRKVDQKLINKIVIFQLLPDRNNFNDTEHPVALAYFDNLKTNNDFLLYENNTLIGNFNNIINTQKQILKPLNNYQVSFNVKNGNLCINTTDNTKNKTNIRFHNANWKPDNEVKNTDRNKVKMLIKGPKIDNVIINLLNAKITELRQNNCDYLWSSFKGVSQTGNFRKRLDFKTIKKIINSILIK